MRQKTSAKIELPDFMTKKQVADYLSLSVRTVERMMMEGLQSIKLRGKRYITKSQLNEYIAKVSKTA